MHKELLGEIGTLLDGLEKTDKSLYDKAEFMLKALLTQLKGLKVEAKETEEVDVSEKDMANARKSADEDWF